MNSVEDGVQVPVDVAQRSGAQAYAMEAGVGVASASLVAPIISIVDKAIIENAAGVASLRQSITDGFVQLVRHPTTFFRGAPFLWIVAVYGCTYAVGNVSEQVMRRRQSTGGAVAGVKFAASSTTNAYMSVMKDRAFASKFGGQIGQQVVRSVPPVSLSLFALRDAITVGASFTAPPLVAKAMSAHFPNTSPTVLTNVAQLTVPLAAQLVNTPLYLLGLHLYNVPKADTRARISFIGTKYVGTVAARWGRILPAFGIGGVANRHLRTKLSLL